MTWPWPWPVLSTAFTLIQYLCLTFESVLAELGLFEWSWRFWERKCGNAQFWPLTWPWPDTWPFKEINSALEPSRRDLSIAASLVSLRSLFWELARGRYTPLPPGQWRSAETPVKRGLRNVSCGVTCRGVTLYLGVPELSPPPNHGLSPLPMMVRKGVKNMKRNPVSTHAIPNILKNVPPLFSSFQQSIKYYYHCSDIRNAYVNDMLPIFISAINGNGVCKLSYSYRTSIAKYFDLVVTIEIYIYWPNIVSFSAHTCAGIVHPNRVNRWPEPLLAALAALAKISAPFGSPIHA